MDSNGFTSQISERSTDLNSSAVPYTTQLLSHHPTSVLECWPTIIRRHCIAMQVVLQSSYGEVLSLARSKTTETYHF